MRSSPPDRAADRTPRPGRTGTGIVWLAGIAIATVGVLVAPYLRHGYRFGIGSDMPVYLWWTRVGSSEGLSLVGARPGSPALIAVLAGTLHVPVVAAAAGLEAALGGAIATAMAALTRAANPMGGEHRGARAAWVVAGLLCGLFTVHLAAGYVANLVFAAPFIAATVCLATGSRRGAIAAAIAFAGGGLAHPQFFLVGVAILGGVAVWSIGRHERGWMSDAGRVAIATAGAGSLLAAGLLSMRIGPAPLRVDTSKDGFLRRAGLADALRSDYGLRFLHHWTRYVQWLAVPLAALGLMRTSGFARRVLIVWSALVVLGAPIGLLTGWYPADRVVTFGFAIPALAGVGVVAVRNWFGRREKLGAVVAGVLVGAMAAGALMAWSRQSTYISLIQVDHVTEAARIADATSEPGTPLVFLVDDSDSTASYLATQAANVIRAAMPADRVADVFVYVGTPENYFAGRPTIRDSSEYNALSRLYLSDIPGGPATAFLLTSFDRRPAAIRSPGLFNWNGGVYSSVRPTTVTELGPPREPLRPSSPWKIVFSSLAILVLFGAVGFAWTRWAGLDGIAAAASAPAFGVGTLVLAGILVERVGLSLHGGTGPSIATLIAAGTGVVLLLAQGKPAAPATPPIQQQPGK